MDLILDANNLEYRSFWIGKTFGKKNPKEAEEIEISEDGEKKPGFGGIYIFLGTLRKLVEEFRPERVWACWDKKLIWPSSNFRKDMLKGEYKATRDNEAAFSEMYSQEDLLIEVLKVLGCINMHPRVLEADDVISWLSRKAPADNMVVSTDNDLYQLISERTSFYNLNKKSVICLANFESEIGIEPEHFVKWKSIQGDKSDNISGLKGFGKKKAAKLARAWDTEAAKLSPEQQELVDRNITVIDLSKSWEMEDGEEDFYDLQFEDARCQQDLSVFKGICEKMNFQRFLKNFDKWVRPFKSLTEAPQPLEVEDDLL